MKSKHLLLMLLLALLAPWAANAQSPLFSEDFESGSMPTGWTTDGSGSWSVSTGDYSSSTGAGQGSYNAKIEHSTTGAATKLITPEIDLSSVASAELSFMHVQRSWAGDIDGLKVYYRTSSSGTWTLLEEYTSAYASWTTEEGIVLPNLSSTYQVAFEYIDHYGYGLGVDNVIITQGASCVKPSTLTATAPYGYDAAHCILLEWEGGSGSYNVQLKKASESEEQWQTKAGGVSLLSMLFNDLDPATTYNARVQSVCGGDVSDWKNVTFTTACDAISTFPWTEDFGSATTSTVPNCWDNSASTSSTLSTYPERIWGVYEYSSNKMLRMYNYFVNTGTALINSPSITLPASGDYQLTFGYSHRANCGDFTVKVSTDGGVSFIDLQSFSNNGSNDYSNPGEFTEATISLATYVGQTIILQFFSTANYSSGAIFIDNIRVGEAPSCLKPTDLSADNITTSSADLSWTAQSGETTWNIYYKKTSEELWEEVQNVTANPYTLQGLDPASNYQFKVVAKCSATDLSEETQPVAFTTECESISALGYTENFDSYTAGNNVLPTCWKHINTTTYTNYSYYPRINSSNAHSASNSLYLYSSYSSWSDYDPQPQYAILPVMTGLAGMQVALYAKGYNTSSTFKIGTMSNPNDATTFTMIAEQTLTTSYPAEAFEYIIPTTCTDNYLAIMIDAATSTRTTNGVYIDDIDIHEPPSCAKPTNVTATTPYGHGATINWNAGNDETAWQICVIDNNVESAPIDVTSKPHTLSGLDPETTYQVKVRANCGGSFSEWTNAISFTTTVACPAPTSLTGEANEFDATITWESFASEWQVAYSTDNTADPDENIDGTATSTTYTKTGLPLGDHYFWVRAICGGEDGNSTWAGPVSVHIGYCVPNPTSHDGSGITGVTFGMGSNVVENGNGTTSLPASAPYYGDYSSMIGAVQAGVESTISITTATGSYPYTFVIWVDLDNNMSFDDSEVLYIGKAASGAGTHNATITIPATQATGDYRMRIYGADSYFSNFYNNGSTNWEAAHDPCVTGTYRHAHDYTLRVLEAPSCMTPTNVAISYTSGTSAEITWDGTATSYNIDINGTVTNNVTSPYTLPLELSTTYTVMVQANCGASGISEWSNSVSYTSPSCWGGYVVEYTLNDSYGDGWNGNAINIIDACGTVKETLTIESGYTNNGTITLCGEYYQFVWEEGRYSSETSFTVNVNGTEFTKPSSLSDGQVLYTVGTISCPAPTNLSNEAPTINSALLSWEENGTAVAWQLCINDDMDNLVEVVQNDLASTSGNTRSYNLSGLNQETPYTVKVRAKCSTTDQSCWSEEVSFTTLASCVKPTDFAATNPGPHSIDLSWTENGTATQWQICLNGDETQPVTANTNPFTLTGLDPETGYTVKVRAYCDATDQSAWSSEISFITDVACPAPTNLDATNITAQTATLEWNGTAAGEYEVRYAEGEAMQELYHNDGAYSTSIGLGGGEFEWGVMFPAGTYTENKLTKVSVYDQSAMTGTVNIYNDGATEPDATALVATKAIEFTGAEDWIDITFNDVTIDPTQNVWIIFDNVSGAGYPAAACADAAGDVNGRWVGLSGTWSDLANAGMSGYAWMIRAIVEDYDAYGSSVTTTDETYTLTNLTPATTYTAQVRAICGSTDGESAWVSTVFTTETFTMTKNIVANSWYALSSPVNTPNVTDVTNLTVDDYDFYRYNEELAKWENVKYHTDFTAFENGRGYIYRRSNGATLTFTGVPNTSVSYTLTAERSGDLQGFNLLGNPYTTPYTYNDLCYALTDKGTWMAKIDYSIPVCEAVLVQVDETAPFNFPVTNSKSAPKAAQALAFTVSGNGYEDVTYAMLEDGKGLNKVAHLADEAPALSIPVDGSNYAIAYLGYEVESFPLTLNATAGEYTIALNNQISGLSYCHLLDKVTGKETDLLKGAYTFKANGNSDRFTVLLNASLENGEIAIWNGNSWIVNGEGTLQVFDVMGRRVYNQEVAGQSSLNTDELATGVYVIRLGEKSQKIVVK